MRFMIPLLWAAGAVQLAIIAANFVLPKKLSLRENPAVFLRDDWADFMAVQPKKFSTTK